LDTYLEEFEKMADAGIEWPNPPIPDDIRALVTELYLVTDSRDDEAPRRLSTELFAPTGEIATNRLGISRTEGVP